MPTRTSLTLVALTLTTVALGSPNEEFDLRPAEVRVGDAWSMRMSTRVETDPRVQRDAVAQGKGEFAETSAQMRCKVLARDEAGRIQLETRYAPQSVVVSTRGETTREQSPERTVTTWGQASDLLGAEVGPASLLARGRTRVGDRWRTKARLPVGELAPVDVEFVYRVADAKQTPTGHLLRVLCEGKGRVEAEDGSVLEVLAKGVLHVDPQQADRPQKVVLVYRFRISGGEGPEVATRTTIRLETRP